MKRIKFPIAALGAIIAGIGAFSSAFTPSPKFANYTFFNKDQTGAPNVNTKSEWKYRPDGGCVSASASTSCSVIYSQITVPATDASPSSTATFVSGGALSRQWDGN